MIETTKKPMNPVFPVLNSTLSKQAVKYVLQINVSDNILLGITQGIGNVIMATPLIKALTSMNLTVDILDGGFKPNAKDVLTDMMDVEIITEEQAKERTYLLGIQTIWPRGGLEIYCAQVRNAGNIIKAWKDGVYAHEVEMNMALAYSLNYKGEVPDLYCHYNKIDDTIVDTFKARSKNKEFVGIHVCRSYHHQFYANRALSKPLEIATELINAGYTPVILGHKDCVTEEQRDEYPKDTLFLDGMELEVTAGYIKELDCMINEDSGIMHVAAAMDTPQVAVFGPTSDMKNRPWSEKAAVIKQGLDCQPCQYTSKESTCTRNVCMNVSPEYIVKQVKLLIEKFPKS